MTAPAPTIITADSFYRLPALGKFPAAFTSIPDAAEVGGDLGAWRAMFYSMAVLTLDAVDDDGVALFYQTDRRANGGLISKSQIIMEAAGARGARPLWHKIAVKGLGTSLYRPNYSHLIAIGKGPAAAGKPTPDVFMQGRKHYPDATDDVALKVGFDYLASRGVGAVVDPFCGRGSIGREAYNRGMYSVNIDNDPEQTKVAEKYIGPN